MKQRLQPKSVALINDTLQDNVIMRLINTSCKQFESRMNTLRFSTIEIFIETVEIIDEIRKQSSDYDIKNSYDCLFCYLRDYDESKDNVDAKLAASVIIVWVSILLNYCSKDKMFYADSSDGLLETLPKDSKWRDLVQNIQSRLSKLQEQEDELSKYMCDYICNPKKWLSVQIRDIIDYNGMNKKLIDDLKPHFYSDNQLENIIAYIKDIQEAGNDPAIAKITAQYIKNKKISDYNNSYLKPLWTILKSYELYTATSNNWNKAMNNLLS